MITRFLMLLLLLAPSVCAAIAYVGGTTSSGSLGATTPVVTYSGTSGNTIVVVHTTTSYESCAISSITDTGGNTYVQREHIANDGSGGQQDWVYTSITTASLTSLTINHSGSCIYNGWTATAVGEYSGVSSISATTTNNNNATPSVTLTLANGGDYLILGAQSGTGALTASVGTRRQLITGTSGGQTIYLADNTNASAVSVSVTLSGGSGSGSMGIMLVGSGGGGPTGPNNSGMMNFWGLLVDPRRPFHNPFVALTKEIL